MAEKYTPAEVASSYLFLFRCPGRTATGNDPRCHINAEPGGYDVGFGMIPLNQVPMPFEKAKEYALAVQTWIAYVVDHDRKGAHETRPPRNLSGLREVDVYSGRDAWVDGEAHIRLPFTPPSKRLFLYSEPIICPYGFVIEVRRGPNRVDLNRFVLVVPPHGTVYELPKAPTIEGRVWKLIERHPELPAVYTPEGWPLRRARG